MKKSSHKDQKPFLIMYGGTGLAGGDTKYGICVNTYGATAALNTIERNWNQSFYIPKAGVLRNLFAWGYNVPGGGENCVVTVRVNGAASTLTTTIGAAAYAGNDVIHDVVVSAGDFVTIQWVNSAGSGHTNVQAYVEYVPNA